MIKIICGGIGSGKTLTTIKEVVTRNKKCFINFPIEFDKATRLEESHIIKVEEDGKKTKRSVNWAFWNDLIDKKENFDIYIDEAHNVLSSRRSMSGWNHLFTSWLTQVRKFLGNSETNHLYLITQRLKSLDPIARDLCYCVIHCRKVISHVITPTKILEREKFKIKKLQDIWIFKTYFHGENCCEKYEAMIEGFEQNDGLSYFYGNPFFKYYDSYALVVFGESAYL